MSPSEVILYIKRSNLFASVFVFMGKKSGIDQVLHVLSPMKERGQASERLEQL